MKLTPDEITAGKLNGSNFELATQTLHDEGIVILEEVLDEPWVQKMRAAVSEQLNAKYINTSKAEEKFLAVRARCLNSDIFAVFNQFDLLHKGYLDRDEFGEFMEELDIVLSDAEREQVEEFFADGKVTFGEFKDFYLDHTQRTIQQRRSTISERLESTPRGRAAKKKFQSKVRSLSAEVGVLRGQLAARKERRSQKAEAANQ